MSLDTLKPAPPDEQQLAPRHPTDVLPPEGHLDVNMAIPDDISSLDKKEGSQLAIEAPDDPELAAKIEPIRIVLVSLDSNVDQFAREAAHEKLAVRDKDKPFLKRFSRSVWHTLTREYQIVKATKEARDEILERRNLRHHQGESDDKWREAAKRRYSSKYAEHLIHEEKGETLHKLSGPEAAKDPNAQRINNDIKNIMRERAKGAIKDKASLDMILERRAEEWRAAGISQDYIAEAQFLVANLDAAGEQIDAAVEAVMGLKNLDRAAAIEYVLEHNVEVVAGEAKVGSRIEMEATRTERLVEKMKTKRWLNEGILARVGSAVTNEVVMSAMMSVAFLAAKKGAVGAASRLVPGIGAAIVVAFRERRAILDDRDLMGRRSDADKEVAADNKLQAQVEAALYKARAAGELIDGMGALYNEAGDLVITTREQLDEAIRLQAEIQARLSIERRQKNARLINFSDISSENMEDRRFDLELASAKLEEDLKRLFNDPQEAAMLGIEGEKYEEIFSAEKFIKIGQLNGEMEAAEKLLNKLMRKRILIRVGITLATMGLVKEGAEEVIELGGRALSAIGRTVSRAGRGVLGVLSRNDQPNMRLASEHSDLAEHTPDTAAEEGLRLADNVDEYSSDTDNGVQSGLRLSDEPGGRVPDDLGGRTPDVLGGRIPDELGGRIPDNLGTQEGLRLADEVGEPVSSDTGTQSGLRIADEIGGRVPDDLGGRAPDVLGRRIPDELGGRIPDIIGGHESVTYGEQTVISDTAKVTLPEGFKAETATNGTTVTVTTPEGQRFNVELAKDGTLSPEAIDAMKAHGLVVEDHTEQIQGEPKVTQQEMSATEFAEKHKHEMVKITHTKWYDNNTSQFDLNELGLRNHLQDNGDIVISVKGMTSGGSFHGASGIDWQEAAAQGKLMIYLSASEGTQAQAFEIPVNPDGTVTINKDSPAAALFDERGKFIGGYQEVAVKGGVTADGATKIATLATVVGKETPALTDTIVTPTYVDVHSYTISPEMYELSRAVTIENGDVPYVFGVPIYARSRLGEGTKRAPPPAAPKSDPGAPTPTPPRNAPPAITSGGSGYQPPAINQQPVSPNGGNQGPAYSFEEQSFLNELRATPLRLPRGFGVNLGGLTSDAQYVANKMILVAIASTPRFSGESYYAWRVRVVKKIHEGAKAALNAAEGASDAMKPIYKQAIRALQTMKVS